MFETIFEPETKTWRGPAIQNVYNPDANLGQIILAALKKNPNSITQICADTEVEVTCYDMWIRTIRIAIKLKAMGYQKGDIVGVIALNSELLAPLVFACFTLGIGLNFLAPNATVDDIVHMWGITTPTLVFCDYDYIGIVEDALKILKLSSPIITLLNRHENYKHIEDLLEPQENEKSFSPPNLGNLEEVIGIILCSSGSTGLPKPVSISQKQITTQMIPFWHADFEEEDVIFNFSTLYWITGFIFLIVGTLYCSKRIITKQSANINVLLDVIEKYSPTTVLTVPFLVSEFLNLDRLKQLHCIKNYITSGTVISPILAEKLSSFIPNGRIVNAYGSTENAAVVTQSENKFDSIGKLAQNFQMKIVNDEDENLGPNEIGEICTKPSVPWMGYYKNLEQTKATYIDGWIKMGDMGYVNDAGYIFLVGRKKEILKYNGYHVSPVELENIINQIDGIMDSCIVGIQENTGNDIIYAVVRKNAEELTEQTIIEYVNARVSEVKKIRGGVVFVNEFPLTSSGKLLRRKVTELLESRLKQTT